MGFAISDRSRPKKTLAKTAKMEGPIYGYASLAFVNMGHPQLFVEPCFKLSSYSLLMMMMMIGIEY